jgi:hypothetical protein
MGANKYQTHSKGSLYKLWDKVNEFYMSSNSKTTWNSLTWIARKLLDIKKWGGENWDSSNYEVHEFEISFKRNIDVAEVVGEELEKRSKKGASQKRMKELQPIIMQYFPGIPDFTTARRVYSSGLMKETVVERIKPLMTEYFECEKIAG